MSLGMLEGMIKQMVGTFTGSNADDILANMKKQPQASQLFGMMNKIGLNEDKFKKMINDGIINRQAQERLRRKG